jgi:hypothetical protein
MSDRTTEGYAATEAEVEGMVRNLCAYALSEPDPLQRYVDLTHQQVLFEGMVAAIRRERGRALADLVVAGMPIADAAKKTNLETAPRVNTLIRAAGQADRVKAATAKSKARAVPVTDEVAMPAVEISVAITAEAPAIAAAPQVTLGTDKRVLTAAERVALGLPPESPIPRAKAPRRRRARASA